MMTTTYKRTEGIVVRNTLFQDHDHITSLFSPTEGLIKLFTKGRAHQRKNHEYYATPLNIVEAVYCQGRSDLALCREVSVLNNQLKLRTSLPILEAACDMLHTITATQFPGKSAPELYQLLIIYLKRLPEMKDPRILSSSFRLKTLRYEGLLQLEAFKQSTLEERQLLDVLALSKELRLFALLDISESLVDQIKNHFVQSL